MRMTLKLFGSATFSTLFTMAIAQLLPDPSDLIHFAIIVPWLMTQSELAPRWFVAFVAFADWYLVSFIWYMILAGIAMVLYERDCKWSTITTVVFCIMTMGFVVGVLAHFVYTGSWWFWQ